MFLSTGMFNMHCIHLVMVRLHVPIEEGWKQKARQRSSRLFGGQNLFNSLPHLMFCLGQFERKGLIHPTFLQINRGKTASAARNWTNFVPQTDATTFALSSNSILLLCMYLWIKLKQLKIIFWKLWVTSWGYGPYGVSPLENYRRT